MNVTKISNQTLIIGNGTCLVFLLFLIIKKINNGELSFEKVNIQINNEEDIPFFYNFFYYSLRTKFIY